MRNLIISFVVLLAGSTLSLNAQKPAWVNNTPEEKNPTYKFVEVVSYGNNLDAARMESIKKLASDEQLIKSVSVYVDRTSDKDINQVFVDGRLKENISNKINVNTQIKGKEFNLQASNIDEYYTMDGNVGKLHTLYMVTVAPEARFDDVYLTTKYGVQGLWRSAIVPGWGQFHKGSKLKGACMLGGCAALAAGIILTENTRVDYNNKITKTHSAQLKRDYANKADNFATARNIFIGATAALYIYNLVDAVVAPGARRIVVKSGKRRNTVYSFQPLITPNGDAGLSASIEF